MKKQNYQPKLPAEHMQEYIFKNMPKILKIGKITTYIVVAFIIIYFIWLR